MDYEKKYNEALERAKYYQKENGSAVISAIFPELKESEDEKTRKAIISALNYLERELSWDAVGDVDILDAYAWLEKQGEQKLIMNVPPREVILSIWDLGNEWKELTKGSISTEYGTQLNYIQKHWHESEYYLREKQGEQNHTWSEEDEKMLYDAIGAVGAADYYTYDDKVEIERWLKSLKQRIGG